jgi:hypothetical protein
MLRDNAIGCNYGIPLSEDIIYEQVYSPLFAEKFRQIQESDKKITPGLLKVMAVDIERLAKIRLNPFFSAAAVEGDARKYLDEIDKIRKEVMSWEW